MKTQCRKVYVPVLMTDFGHIVDGEEQETEEDAKRLGVAMGEEYMEETGEQCYIQIDTRLIFYRIMGDKE